MGAAANDSRLDRDPAHARCDICRHGHACYIGGAPPSSSRSDWERHACLGCLMRASSADPTPSCAECTEVDTVKAGPRDA